MDIVESLSRSITFKFRFLLMFASNLEQHWLTFDEHWKLRNLVWFQFLAAHQYSRLESADKYRLIDRKCLISTMAASIYLLRACAKAAKQLHIHTHKDAYFKATPKASSISKMCIGNLVALESISKCKTNLLR